MFRCNNFILKFFIIYYSYISIYILQLNIALNGKIVEEFSTIVHASKARAIGRQICEKMLDILPRQMFEIVIQAVVTGKVLARENLKAYKKDVTAKLVNNSFHISCIVYFHIFLLLISFILVRW